VLADGKPVFAVAKMEGARKLQQFRGADLCRSLFHQAAQTGLKVGLLGGAPAVLDILNKNLVRSYPGLSITYSYSLPFRASTPAEDEEVYRQVKEARVQLLFIGLGCPKQEKWANRAMAGVHCPMLCVGAVFDFFAGTKPEAPRFFRALGLEWLYRWMLEPRRLFKRYFIGNPRFLMAAVMYQLTGKRKPS
jgi:N-acetylglucosaminyldiphosphoundecaprenol N-acetyl-beta-D-mannosaminyltransferase